MRTLRTALASILLPLVLAIGCSKPGSEFVGKWVNSGDSTDTMQITRTGDQFQIIGSDNQPMNATFSDGALHVPMPMGSVDMKYDKGTDSIQTPGLFGTAQYKRAK